MCDHGKGKGNDKGAYFKLQRLLLELGWDVPKELYDCCNDCLVSMTNDVLGELTAQQSRQIQGLEDMFTVVDPNSEPYRIAESRFHESLKNQVVRVEQINNPALHEQFLGTLRPDGEVRWLFHGSNNDNYVSIAKGGFDMKRSKDGSLGYGVYFAEHASYSSGFTNTLKTQGSDVNVCNGMYGNMLLCKVNLIPGDAHGADIHCIKDDRRAYPQYIIYYKLKML